jgi:hypothetical protein
MSAVSCLKIEGPNFPDYVSPRAVVETPSSPASDNVSIAFTLISDNNAPATVSIAYSTDVGVSFFPCAIAGSAITGLETAAFPGVSNCAMWDSVANGVGLSGGEDVIIKVDAGGTPGETVPFSVVNTDHNSPPSASVQTPGGTGYGNIRIDYSLHDVESNNCSIIAYFSVDDGANWSPAIMSSAGNGVVGLNSSPGGTSHVFYWDSRADNVAMNASNLQVKFRIAPFDAFHQGTAGDTNAFTVNNTITNLPPTVTITAGPANGSTIMANDAAFTWNGSDTDGTVTCYYYSMDHDPPDILTTSTARQFMNLSNTEHTFRIIAIDNSNNFSSVETRTFTVAHANAPPTVFITGGPNGATTDNTPSFSFIGFDSDGTVVGYYVSIDNPFPENWTTSTTYTAPAELAFGNHVFYVRSRDDSGADSEVSSRSFSIEPQQHLNATIIGTCNVPGVKRGFAVTENHAFIACDTTGLQVVDISDRAAPKIIGAVDTPGAARGVCVNLNFVYIADGLCGLQIYDITNASNPGIVGTCDTPGNARDVSICGDYAFIADDTRGLQVIDLTEITAPMIVGNCSIPGAPQKIIIEGNYAYLSCGGSGVQIVDITNPLSPSIAGFCDVSGSALEAAVSGEYVFVADEGYGLQVFSIVEPQNPLEISEYIVSGRCAHGIDAKDNYVYLAAGDSGALIIDVSNPSAPAFISGCLYSDYTDMVKVRGNYLFITAESSSFKVFRLSN